MTFDAVADRFAGALVGQALGDALGFIVEGHGPEACGEYVRSAVRPRKLEGYWRGPFPIGQYSDDTQLARELVLSLVTCRGFDAPDYASRIASLFTEGRIVGRGRATEAAAFRISQGVAWDQAGTPAPSAGNGSAMRAAPVGLLYAHDPEKMLRVAHDQGRITHQDRRCSAGSIAIAGATAWAVTHGSIDGPALCNALSEWTRPYDAVLAAALEQLPRWTEDVPAQVVLRIAQTGCEPAYTDGWLGISPFVTPSVLWALYCVIRSEGDYWETICMAIEAGGDVDTTAAMAGAITGAVVGFNELPHEATSLVNDLESWKCDELVRLATELSVLHRQLGKL